MAAAGWAMVRHAEDFVLLCRTQAGAPQAWDAVRTRGSQAGQPLPPEKTRVVDAGAPGGLGFPGHHLERGMNERGMKRPRQKSLRKRKERVRAKPSRLDGRSLEEIVTDVNRSLRGWHQYFQQSKAGVFTAVDGDVRRRLRSVRPWRLDGRGQGTGAAHPRWPNEWLARRGLLSLAAEHQRTRTIAGLRTR